MMHPKILEKIGSWVSQAFDQVGDFCQVEVSLDQEAFVVGTEIWPAEEIAAGRRIAAIHRVRGEDGHTIGFATDRSLWTYLSGYLMMLMPAAIEDNLKVTQGPLEEDDLDFYGEIGNVMTGVLNQAIQESTLVEPLQLEFLGPSGPDAIPEGSNFPDDEMVTLSVAIKANDKSYNCSLFLNQELIDRWFAPLMAAQVKEVEEAEREAETEVTYDDIPGIGETASNEAGTSGTEEIARSTSVDGSVKPWLVVDSSDMDREHMARLLSERELAFRGTRSMEDAIRAIKQNWCEGILLDCVLADGDGLEFLKRLRNNFLTNDLPIIVTARDMTRDLVMDAIRAGASHVLVKPVESDALEKGMERIQRLRPTVTE